MKGPEAFRTIGEVSDELGLPAHVLRFWEERFPAVKPVKRAGNRRYYRAADVALLRAIQALLHGEGRTIAGVQKLIAEKGAAAVAAAYGGGESTPAAAAPPEDWRQELRAVRDSLAAAIRD